MESIDKYLLRLAGKGKRRDYISASGELLKKFHAALGDKPPSSAAIDRFVRSMWSGYVSRDRAAYQILDDYADFCEAGYPLFTGASVIFTVNTSL